MNAPFAPTKAERDRKAAEALARFRAQWPPERCERLGRMLEGDYSQVWAEALAPKEADTPADHAVRDLLTDAELQAHSRNQRAFARNERRGAF